MPAELDLIRAKGVPLRDLAYRYRSQLGGDHHLPIVIDLVDADHLGRPEPVNCALLVEITAKLCRWTFMTGSVTAAAALTEAFKDFLSRCLEC